MSKFNPLRFGDVVWYYDKKEASRTGTFIRVIERTGKNFGMCIIKDSVSKANKKVKPEWVQPVNTGDRS